MSDTIRIVLIWLFVIGFIIGLGLFDVEDTQYAQNDYYDYGADATVAAYVLGS